MTKVMAAALRATSSLHTHRCCECSVVRQCPNPQCVRQIEMHDAASSPLPVYCDSCYDETYKERGHMPVCIRFNLEAA